jgi:hypothetical protein
MESSKLLRIVLALAVGGVGVASYASNASADGPCTLTQTQTSSGTNWAASNVCCTGSNGAKACSWGEFDSFGNKWMKATADAPPPPPTGCGHSTIWEATGLNTSNGMVCVKEGARNGTFPGIGNTASVPCNGGVKTRIGYFQLCRID